MLVQIHRSGFKMQGHLKSIAISINSCQIVNLPVFIFTHQLVFQSNFYPLAIALAVNLSFPPDSGRAKEWDGCRGMGCSRAIKEPRLLMQINLKSIAAKALTLAK